MLSNARLWACVRHNRISHSWKAGLWWLTAFRLREQHKHRLSECRTPHIYPSRHLIQYQPNPLQYQRGFTRLFLLSVLLCHADGVIEYVTDGLCAGAVGEMLVDILGNRGGDVDRGISDDLTHALDGHAPPGVERQRGFHRV